MELIFLYCIAFAVAVAMPGRRSLLGLAILAAAPTTWLSFSAVDEIGEAHGGAVMGAIFGAAFVWSIAAGLWAGIVTRALLLWIRRFVANWFATGTILICGLVALPAAWMVTILAAAHTAH
ncbi:hypothetical protein [Ralstonia solanacearum]|uniref:hypothetical protein n=1 Tax=Ralstonia solanacearum TaxID=305 RepID=UPI0012D4BBAB|nr:hypothetical protein [Ralstonia solanacearum]MDC6176746.1 hypothetical protein [Ralstonia solanacearum]MDC6209833.1 hypothetical protein [Ralstonia solanacearum]MDC6240795.1 hypothetical protein [Ralstonia solanacearum]MDD7800123.1 hypothetical protein [Ralstonia solanacearum]